jgi:uncharacterized protein YjgD (DUF1641 family)
MDDSPPVSQLTPLLELLARLDGRLARIEDRLAALESVASYERALPDAAALAVDALDDAARRLQDRGVDLEQRVSNALTTLERLTRDQTTEQLAQALELAQAAPNALAMLVDVLDQRMGALDERGVHLDERLAAVARLAEKLTAPQALAIADSLLEHLPSFERLLSSDVPGTGPVDMLSRAGRALSEAQRTAIRPLGPFGLLRAMSDSHVQYALGFAITFARAFGRSVEPSQSPRLPDRTGT